MPQSNASGIPHDAPTIVLRLEVIPPQTRGAIIEALEGDETIDKIELSLNSSYMHLFLNVSKKIAGLEGVHIEAENYNFG